MVAGSIEADQVCAGHVGAEEVVVDDWARFQPFPGSKFFLPFCVLECFC